MPASPKIQALINAGLITGRTEDLSEELLEKLETLTEAEITHLLAVKEKLGKIGDDNQILRVAI